METKQYYEKPDLNDVCLIFICPFSAALANFCCIIALLFWRPDPHQLPVFFVFPALWGMADAIWQTQTNGKKIQTALHCLKKLILRGTHTLLARLFV